MNPMTLAPLLAADSWFDFSIAFGPCQNVRGYPLNAKEYSRGCYGVIRRTSPKAPSRRDNIRAGVQPKNRFA